MWNFDNTYWLWRDYDLKAICLYDYTEEIVTKNLSVGRLSVTATGIVNTSIGLRAAMYSVNFPMLCFN